MTYLRRVVTEASEDRLEHLIQERLKPGADKDAIDKRIWDLFGEDWAVMFTDLSGFSRHSAKFGIVHFLQVILESERIFVPCIEDHDGFLLKMDGDSMLIIFRNAAKALDCAIAMQRKAKQYNVGRPEEELILLCVGLGQGPMIRVGDHDVFGAQVNAASKLGEDTAEAWEILATAEIRQAVADRTDVSFAKLDIVPPGASAAYRVNFDL